MHARAVTHSAGSDDAAVVGLAQARDQLMAGRGPGVDSDAIAAAIDSDRAELARTLQVLGARLSPAGLLRRGLERVPAPVTAAALVFAAVILVSASRRGCVRAYRSATAKTEPNAVTPTVSHAM